MQFPDKTPTVAPAGYKGQNRDLAGPPVWDLFLLFSRLLSKWKIILDVVIVCGACGLAYVFFTTVSNPSYCCEWLILVWSGVEKRLHHQCASSCEAYSCPSETSQRSPVGLVTVRASLICDPYIQVTDDGVMHHASQTRLTI